MNKQFANLKQVSSIDFRNNKQQLLLSYLLRAAGMFVFGALLLIITKYLANNDEIIIKELINIELKSIPPIFSIFLIILDIVFILFLHELIHASVLFITHRQNTKIGIRSFIIYAAAPESILTKIQFIITALSPFLLISIIGCLLIFFIPHTYLSWVFIPTVVNAAAAGVFLWPLFGH
ncbi:MAG: DUF3267 domain-containing protein [Thiohalospira sp.]